MDGAKKMMTTAIDEARTRPTSRSRSHRRCRRPCGRCSSAWTAAASTPCIRAPPRRCAPPPTSAPPPRKGAVGAGPRRDARAGLGARRRPGALDRDGGRLRRVAGGECIGGVGVSGGDWADRLRIAQAAVESIGATMRGGSDGYMSAIRRVACIGMGWWSDVLADAINARTSSDRLLLHALGGQARGVRRQILMQPGRELRGVLADPAIEAIINTTPNDVHLPTTRAAAGPASTSSSTSRSPTVSDGRAITESAARPA